MFANLEKAQNSEQTNLKEATMKNLPIFAQVATAHAVLALIDELQMLRGVTGRVADSLDAIRGR